MTHKNKLEYPIDINKFLDMDFPGRQSFWGEGLLDPRSKLVITGPGKIGKSNFVLNLAISLASGKPFLGFEIPHKKKVLYIQQEISEMRLQDRLRLMVKNDIHVKKGFFSLKTIRGLDIQNEEHFDIIGSWISKKRYEIVIFDPLYQFHNSDENSALDMKQVVSKFDELIDAHKISVIIVHHHNKGNSKNHNAIRGSAVLFDWGDSYIMLNDINGKTGDIRISWKLRNAENPDSLYVSMDANLWIDVGIPDQGLKSLNILELIKSSGEEWIQQKTLLKLVLEKMKLKGSAARKHLKKMTEEKVIVYKRDSGNVFWKINDEYDLAKAR